MVAWAQSDGPSDSDSAARTPTPHPGDVRDPRAAAPPPEAIEHYERGRDFYLAGRYRDALVELKAALDYDPHSPDLVYNVARVYENLGEFDQAIDYYQRYMGRLPANADKERKKTQDTIRRLQGAKRELLAHRSALELPSPPPPASIGRADLAFWLSAGGAIALLGGGAVTGVLALEKNDAVASFVVGPDGSFKRRDRLATQADRLALVSDGLLIGAAAAFTAAALLYLLRDAEPQDTRTRTKPSVSFGWDGTAGQIRLRQRF